MLVPITTRALVQRINRVLVKDLEALKKARGARAVQDLGEYFLVDSNRNLVLEHDVDVEAKGRELGVLKPFEKLV